MQTWVILLFRFRSNPAWLRDIQLEMLAGVLMLVMFFLKKETQIDYLSILQLQLSINYMQKYCHSLCVSLAGAGERSPLSVGRPVCMTARSGCEDSVNRCPSLVLSYPWLGSLPYLWIPLPLSAVCFSLALCRVGLRYRQLLMVKDPSFSSQINASSILLRELY